MDNKALVYKRFSHFFLAFFLIAVICLIGSLYMQFHDSAKYKDCTITTTGTLTSCVTQKNGGTTYYFGVYSFNYNNSDWNFVSSTYYTKESRVPKAITLSHNAFEKKEDMKAKVKYDRGIAIPFIYAVVALFLLLMYIMYHRSYKEQTLYLQARANIRDIDGEIDQTFRSKDN